MAGNALLNLSNSRDIPGAPSFLGNSPYDMMGSNIGRYLGNVPTSAMYMLKTLFSPNPSPITSYDPDSLMSSLQNLGLTPQMAIRNRNIDPRARVMLSQMFNTPTAQGGNVPRIPTGSETQFAGITP